MRSSLVLGAITAVSIGTAGGAAAQKPFSPDSARPPMLLKATPEEQLRVAVSLQMQRIEHAIQRGDTAALGVLVPDAVIPEAEKPVAARAGCRSLAHALGKLKARPFNPHSTTAGPLGFLHYENQIMISRHDGDTVASFSAKLVDRSKGGRPKFAPFQFTLVRQGSAIQLARTTGVLAGVCGMAVAQ